MDQWEETQEGAPPSKSTLCGEDESQSKAQSLHRNQPGSGSGSGSGSSCVSFRSDESKGYNPDFKSISSGVKQIQQKSGSSCVSFRSDMSKGLNPNFKDISPGVKQKTPVVVDGLTLRFTADYSDATARRRRLCFPVTNRARSLGFHVFLLYPAIIKLTRGPDKITFEDPSEAAKYIDSFVHDASAVV